VRQYGPRLFITGDLDPLKGLSGWRLDLFVDSLFFHGTFASFSLCELGFDLALFYHLRKQMSIEVDN
jgi:hypothetical protein